MNSGQESPAATLEGRHYLTGEPVRITVKEGRIEAISPLAPAQAADRPQPLAWLGPGLVDLQLNGHAGIDFNTPSLTVAAVHEVTRRLWSEGTTTYYPTVITNAPDVIEALVAVIAAARRSDPLTRLSIPGIHLEGPFISPEDGPRGAHDRAHVKAPDWTLLERWQRAAEGLIRIVTLSPEWAEAPAFIERCVGAGITVSIGHTAASTEQIRRAVDAGATMSTHLGNGAHPTLPRHPNYLWEQLAEDRLAACVIADGFHLPESVLRVVRKVKAERAFLVSDAVYLSGMPPGAYDTHIGGRVVLTAEGRLYLAARPELLAGSAQMLRHGLAQLVRAGVCPLAEAWEMASVQPAAYMGLEAGRGLVPGAPADLLAMRPELGGALTVCNVAKAGQLIR